MLNEVDFNPEFISRMIPKLEWSALVQAAEQVFRKYRRCWNHCLGVESYSISTLLVSISNINPPSYLHIINISYNSSWKNDKCSNTIESILRVFMTPILMTFHLLFILGIA